MLMQNETLFFKVCLMTGHSQVPAGTGGNLYTTILPSVYRVKLAADLWNISADL